MAIICCRLSSYRLDLSSHRLFYRKKREEIVRLYHDWEFLETGNSVYPISVGMIREDGTSLYRVFRDAPWDAIRNHDWLTANVVPKLCRDDYNYMSSQAIKDDVREFLSRAHFDGKGKLELWGWYSAYDHVCLGQLFGRMVDLPDWCPMWTNDIRQEVHRLGNPSMPDFREPEELVHNALDDAVAELRMHEWLIKYEGRIHGNVRGAQFGNGNIQHNNF